MKKLTKIIMIICISILLMSLFCCNVFAAVSEDQVRQQVSKTSSESVSGNVFIWFLCAIAFLKISQKIDSFMSSLGINVGHTGGSMLAEAMIAARGLNVAKHFTGGGGFGKGGSHNTSSSGSGGGASVFSGGLAGMASRQFNKGAVHSATNQGGNVISKNAFQNSMAKGGNFANGVIGTVAKGNISRMGSITGQTASDAMTSYMGLAGQTGVPTYSDVEIGGGRIMGTETSQENPNGIQFGMYNTEQYMAPEKGSYDSIQSADGAKWYKQYAASAVERTPYQGSDGKVSYNESVVQKLPSMPKRKDKV